MGRHGTIAGRKAAQDSKRSAMFTKYGKAIIIAARAGGDPEYNPGLRVAIEKAKKIGMPNDNIKRAVQKGTGELGGETLEEITFEGYGIGGIAVIVETLTDNRNRTTSAVRSLFDKHGGNLGTPGCVSYMFNKKGVFIIEKEDGIDEDELMETALEAGAEDMKVNEDSFEIYSAPSDYETVYEALEAAGYELVESEVEYVPDVESAPKDDHDNKMFYKMIDMLEDNDDIQAVHHNCSADPIE